MAKTVVSTNRRRNTLTSDRCSICGEIRDAALYEEHHLAGNHEGATITLCLNCHKVAEHKKEYHAPNIYEKSRTPYDKSCAYILGVGDIAIMHGEMLLQSHGLYVEHVSNTSDEQTALKVKTAKPLYFLGVFLSNAPVIIRNFINKIAKDRELANVINQLIQKFAELQKDGETDEN